jgi:ABC-type sulfate/molybdate transport systems ATPase subunit
MRMLVDEGVPVVLVTHDDEQRARVADAVLELRDGRVVA